MLFTHLFHDVEANYVENYICRNTTIRTQPAKEMGLFLRVFVIFLIAAVWTEKVT